MFIAPSDAGSPSSASPPPSAASPPPNPFGDAPTVLPCTDPDLKKLLTPNPFGDAPTVPPCTDPDLKKLLTTFGKCWSSVRVSIEETFTQKKSNHSLLAGSLSRCYNCLPAATPYCPRTFVPRRLAGVWLFCGINL